MRMARSKFGNRKVVIDGYTFDSQAEGRRYRELKLLEAAGVIGCLRVHPPYQLQEGYKHAETGKRVQAIRYEADFEYIEDGKVVVEDVKAWDKKKQQFILTAVFKLKRKLFESQYYPRVIRIVEA